MNSIQPCVCVCVFSFSLLLVHIPSIEIFIGKLFCFFFPTVKIKHFTKKANEVYMRYNVILLLHLFLSDGGNAFQTHFKYGLIVILLLLSNKIYYKTKSSSVKYKFVHTWQNQGFVLLRDVNQLKFTKKLYQIRNVHREITWSSNRLKRWPTYRGVITWNHWTTLNKITSFDVNILLNSFNENKNHHSWNNSIPLHSKK